MTSPGKFWCPECAGSRRIRDPKTDTYSACSGCTSGGSDYLRGELDDLLADEIGDGYSRVADAVWAIAEARALVERQRTLADARAVIERETDAYPGASPAITSGIWGGFDQWAVSEYGTLANPDRRLCGTCGQRHTQYEYEDAHRNAEGGY